MNCNHLFHRELFVCICMPRDDVHGIQQRYVIYRSALVISELQKDMSMITAWPTILENDIQISIDTVITN